MQIREDGLRGVGKLGTGAPRRPREVHVDLSGGIVGTQALKRGSTWWMSFTYQGQQVRRSTGTSNRQMAEAILGKVKVQIIEGRFFDKPKEESRTFNELIDRYSTEHAARRANYRRNVTSVTHLKAFFGNPKLSHITPKNIVAYKNKRYADGVKPATINRELSTLKKAFNLARREWEWCSDNPVCRVSMEKENNTRDRWLTLEEEQRLLGAALPWLRELIVFAIHTGMRMGEIVALTWTGLTYFVAQSPSSDPRMANGEAFRQITPSLSCYGRSMPIGAR